MEKKHKLKILCLVPPTEDFLCATIVEGLNLLGHEVYTQFKSNETKKVTTNVKKTARESELIILFSNMGYKDRKKFVIENQLESKTIYVDGSDFYYLEDLFAVKHFKIIFKREILLKKYKLKENLSNVHQVLAYFYHKAHKIRQDLFVDESKIIPLPFAAERVLFKANKVKKDIVISCMLRPDKPGRKEVNEAVAQLPLKKVVGVVSPGQFQNHKSELKKKYYNILGRSQMSVSYQGAGFDTGRFWEILANKCLLFSPEIRIKMPHPFIEEKHYVVYKNPEDLKEKIMYYAKHKKELKKIQLEGFKHVLKYHTSEARAQYFLNEVYKHTSRKNN